MEDFSTYATAEAAAARPAVYSGVFQTWSQTLQELGASRVLALAVLCHVVLWTLLPSLLLKNASLDIIEALAWGHE